MAKGKAAEIDVLITEKALRALIKADDDYKSGIAGLTGELREEIGNAVEKKHLDKNAYALLKSFKQKGKTPQGKHRLWHTLVAYMEMSGEMKIVESAPELGLDDNVVKLQTAAE